MQFSDIRTRAAFLAMQAGWDTASPGPDWSGLVNRGYSDFAWDTEFNEEQVDLTTVVNQAIYTIDASTPPRYFQTVKDVAYDTASTTSKILEKTSEDQERILDPLWFVRAASTPQKYAIVGPNLIRLVDKPDTGGVTFTLRGTRQPVALGNDSDLPAFPD
ncbi:MAG TPA: hypothetical protein VKU00_00670, partial [Chthonomonadaceae bacterium]|nr:hypothetical protein [Chthonomonadaceae bacterium]